MRAGPDLRVEQIAAAIARYLTLHPSAADSSRGIMQWWLPTMGMESDSDTVEQALRLLEIRGVVENVSMGDNQRLWRTPQRDAGHDAAREN